MRVSEELQHPEEQHPAPDAALDRERFEREQRKSECQRPRGIVDPRQAVRRRQGTQHRFPSQGKSGAPSGQ